MQPVLSIIILAIQCLITVLTASAGNIVKPGGRKLEYFTIKGWWTVSLSVLVLVLTGCILYFAGEDQKEAERKQQLIIAQRDSSHLSEINRISSSFTRQIDSLTKLTLTTTDSNYSNFINILAAYELGVSQSGDSIIKAVKNSAGKQSERPDVQLTLPTVDGLGKYGFGIDALTLDSIYFHCKFRNYGNATAHHLKIFAVFLKIFGNNKAVVALSDDYSMANKSLMKDAETTISDKISIDSTVVGIGGFFVISFIGPQGDTTRYEKYHGYLFRTNMVSQVTYKEFVDMKKVIQRKNGFSKLTF